MSEQETDVTFFCDNNTISWHFPQMRPDLTTDQAMVIAVFGLGQAMQEIASSLSDVAEAIREKD
jgi:hypothetical protein